MSPPPPLRGGVTDWGHEEVRGCGDVLAGRLGMWWQFRHRHTSYDGCPCSNSSADRNCCVDDSRAHDSRAHDDHCGAHNDCANNDCANHDCGTDHHSGAHNDNHARGTCCIVHV